MLAFSLTSPAFQDGAAIPRAHAHSRGTCGGENVSLPLRWANAPHGTRSFVLTIVDPDAHVQGGWVHWVAYDIAGETRALAAGEQPRHEGVTSFGTPGYGGPCPPVGDPAHHYHITLYALDVDRLGVGARPSYAGVVAAMRGHVLGQAELIGLYQRK